MSAPIPTPTTGGGSPDAPPTTTGAPDTASPTNGTGTATPTTAPPQNEQGSANGTPDVGALRAELTEWRTKAEGVQQDIVEKIARALGITAGDEAPTVEQVTDQLTAAQREARERAVDLAVYRSASAAGADPDALLDSTGFRKRVAALDPSADGFGDKVAAAITAAVKENPRLAATPAAATRSGGQITGGSPSGSDDLGSLSIEDYIKRTRKGRS